MTSITNIAQSSATEEGLLWILIEAKNLLRTDEYAAKTWLLVGKTLFPQSFTIRFEIYSLEKNNKKAAETSLYLEELLGSFYEEEKVWQEVLLLLRDVLKEEGSASDEDVKFHRDVFKLLPRNLQVFVLGDVLRRLPFLLPDINEQSLLLLFVIDNYSEELPNQGAFLVDLWISAEARDKEAALTHVNYFREELVLRVLPKVLSSADQISPTQAINWFIISLEYFVFFAADNYSSSVQQNKDQPSKSDNSSKVTNIDPWQKLRQLGMQIGRKIGWPQDMEMLFDNDCSRKVKHKALDESFRKFLLTLSSSEESGSVNEVGLLKFFSLFMALFFECLHNYSTCLNPQSPSNTCANPVKASRALVEMSLLDDLDTVEDLRAKKPRLEEESDSLPNPCRISSDVVEGFLLAVKIWSSLNGGVFTSRLSTLQNHWLIKKKWPWMSQFNIDLMIYEGRYEECFHLCESMKIVQQHQDIKPNKNRLLLQLICCAYRSLNHKGFLKLLGNLLLKKPDEFPLVPGKGLVTHTSLPNQSNPFVFSARRKQIQLKFISLSDQDVISYAAQAVIGCLWSLWKSQPTSAHSDTIIGHMLVLMQNDIYQNEKQLCELLEHIRRQGRFSYHLFTGYIVDIILLEELMFLQSSEGGHVTLDILSTSIQTSQASRTVTRGVNKDTREEMKAAIEKQVIRCNENISQVIKNFLTQEIEILLREFN